MLIDDVLPRFDVTRVDTTVIAAPEDVVYQTVLNIDLLEIVRDDPVIGVLFAIRGIPDRIMRWFQKRPPVPVLDSLRLADMTTEGEWIRLAENPGREIVFGVLGRFWNGPIEWQQTTKETFFTLETPGSARIVANLAVHPYSPDRVLLTYEARTAASDEDSRRGIARYWRWLSPFIGLVLRSALRAIRRHAEQA